ncbi:hypothetical protein LBMAG53_01310 [Planctomycetota bacterium]|nr:hypothetical protein LBMAG53_01310 [Planctomycetota bacterium]
MTLRSWALLLSGLGVALVLGNWAWVAKCMSSGAGGSRPQHITIWTNSGSPELDKRRAQDFMDRHPDIFVDFNSTNSGNFGSVINVSFLSGNPPDVLDLRTNELRDYVVKGLLRPIDDLLAEQLATDPQWLAKLPGGELAPYRFRANPDDFYLVHRKEYPVQAARLLNMDGKLLGFVSAGGTPALTWNRRLFREADTWWRREHTEPSGLVDDAGQPKAPTTWSGLLRCAEIVSAYGATFPDPAQRPYGIVVQGQKPSDFMRGVVALSAMAGTSGFDFKTGQFAYGATHLATTRLFMLLEARGLVLPGTASRQFEEPRTLLAQGRAAMLIDGAHAGMKGAQSAPFFKQDIGVAILPAPDPEAAKLLGATLVPSVPPREFGGFVPCITAGSRHPAAAWQWMTKRPSAEEFAEDMARSYSYTFDPEIAKVIYYSTDPKWVAYRAERMVPFQQEVYEIAQVARPWPQPPQYGAVAAEAYDKVLYNAFNLVQNARPEAKTAQIDSSLAAAEKQLADFTAEANASLARRVADGDENPKVWTLPDFDPAVPEKAFVAQRSALAMADAERSRLLAELPEDKRGIVFGFRPPWWGWPVVLIGGLIAVTVAAFLAQRAAAGRLHVTLADMRKSWFAYVFVLPAMVSLFAFILYPSLFQFWLAVHRGDGIDVSAMPFVGFDQFIRIWSAPGFLSEIIPRTLLYMVIVAVGAVFIALLLALLLNLPLRSNKVYRTMFFVPMVTSVAAVNVIIICLLGGKDSILNQALIGIGLISASGAVDLLNTASVAIFTVMGVAIWYALPHNTIICLAGLQSIDPALYEAAKLDGAGAWRRFRDVTIPQIRPIMTIVLFNALVGAAMAFTTVYTLTRGNNGTEVVSTYIFRMGIDKSLGNVPDVGYASALGIVYALLLLILTFGNVWYLARRWRISLQEAEGAK